ncbi:Nn.00g105850.m01.CDS01 [Neocucurbitaria sp. VM-36]
MASIFATPSHDFGGRVNTTAASAWSMRTPQQGTPFSFSSSRAVAGSLSEPRTSHATVSPLSMTALPKVQELSYEDLVEVSAPQREFSNSPSPLQDTLRHPSTVPHSTTEILRIYLPFDKLPLSWLNALLLHIHQQATKSPHEVHLCVRSLLLPCLKDIDEDPKLAQALTTLLRKCVNLGTPMKCFFLHPFVQVAHSHDDFANFIERNLLRAIKGLKEHDVELSDILGEESCLFNQSVASSQYFGHNSGSCSEDLDDEML